MSQSGFGHLRYMKMRPHIYEIHSVFFEPEKLQLKTSYTLDNHINSGEPFRDQTLNPE